MLQISRHWPGIILTILRVTTGKSTIHAQMLSVHTCGRLSLLFIESGSLGPPCSFSKCSLSDAVANRCRFLRTKRSCFALAAAYSFFELRCSTAYTTSATSRMSAKEMSGSRSVATIS